MTQPERRTARCARGAFPAGRLPWRPPDTSERPCLLSPPSATETVDRSDRATPAPRDHHRVIVSQSAGAADNFSKIVKIVKVGPTGLHGYSDISFSARLGIGDWFWVYSLVSVLISEAGLGGLKPRSGRALEIVLVHPFLPFGILLIRLRQPPH